MFPLPCLSSLLPRLLTSIPVSGTGARCADGWRRHYGRDPSPALKEPTVQPRKTELNEPLLWLSHSSFCPDFPPCPARDKCAISVPATVQHGTSCLGRE